MNSPCVPLNLSDSVSKLYVPILIAANEEELSSFSTTTITALAPSFNTVTINTLSTAILESILPIDNIVVRFSFKDFFDKITGKKQMKEAQKSLLNLYNEINKNYEYYIETQKEYRSIIINDINEINQHKSNFKENILSEVTKKLTELGIECSIEIYELEKLNEEVLSLNEGLKNIIDEMDRLKLKIVYSDLLFNKILDCIPFFEIYRKHKLAKEIKEKVTEFEKESQLECENITADLVRISIFEKALTNVKKIFDDINNNLIPLIEKILNDIETKYHNNYDKIPSEVFEALVNSCKILKGMAEKKILENTKKEATIEDVINYSNELSWNYNNVKEEILKCG